MSSSQESDSDSDSSTSSPTPPKHSPNAGGDVRPVHYWYPPFPIQHEDDDFPTHTSREQREVERRVDESLRYVLPPKKKTSTPGAGGRKKKNFFGGDDDEEDQNEQIPKDQDSISFTSCPALCELSFSSHAMYLLGGLMGSGCHSSLDSSRPWLVYWCLHGLDVLDHLRDVNDELALSCVRFLGSCFAADGGVGGGPNQQAHTAPTYAAVLSLAILSSHPGCSTEAINLLRSKRRGIYEFHLRCKVDHIGRPGAGGFRVSRDGEVDTRGAYTVVSIASLLNCLTPTLTAGVADWLVTCQTYEGGIGGEPGTEAHGGYAFCGLAAAVLLKASHRLNIPLLLKWASHRQMEREGGFQGRTNKLVDGCYSFWMGALFPLLHALIQMPQQQLAANETLQFHPPPTTSTDSSSSNPATVSSSTSNPTNPSSTASSIPAPTTSLPLSPSNDSGWLFDTLALQRYVLVSCQMAMGGLRDKPGKHADLYHTCYCLSGLGVAQHATTFTNSPILGKEENLLVR